jgi:anti-sigma B factor antagonist
MTVSPPLGADPKIPVDFTIRAEQRDGQCIYYRCAGELDIATAPILWDALNQTEANVILNFAAVSFLDSSGIAALAAQQTRLRTRGHTLRVHALRDAPRRALQITGLLDALT